MTSASINVVEIRKLNQYLGAFVASLGGFALGISLGWNSRASIVLKNNFDATAEEIGLIGEILNVGVSIGAIMMPFIVGRITRINILFVTMFVLVLTWTIVIGHGQRVFLMVTGRLICGVCGGLACILTPMYVAEIASKEIRGHLLAHFHILVNFGIMYAFIVAHSIDEESTIWMYSKICGLACLSIAPVKYLPESPLYYLSKNDENNAEKSLRWYRGDTYDIQHEINGMKRLLLTSRTKLLSKLKLLRNRRVLRSIATCFGVMASQHLCGVNMMIFYALTFFDMSGSGELTGSEQTLVVGAVQIFASILAAYLVSIVGRRILLTVSTLLMGVFLILLGYFFKLRDADPENDDIYFWMAPTWATLIFAAYNLGLGPISWSILGDTLPEELKVPVASGAVAFGWLISLIATLTFEDMIIKLGGTKVMWLSAAICWLIALFCAIVVKDTSGKSLIEIQEDFQIEPNRNAQQA